MKVGLLECDHVAERFQHIAGDYRALFAALFSRCASQLTLHPFDVCHGEFPAALADCEAYLCTGSRFSVYDDAGWIHELKAFVRELHASGKPFVGICFGHQILAEALGGKVAKAPQGWGLGLHVLEITRQEAWMQPPQTQCRLLYSHQDQVQSLPANGVLLGSSAHCPVAVFRVGQTMLGVQGHPEFPAAYLEALLLDRVERLGAERVAAARTSLRQAADEAVVAQWIAHFLAGQAGRKTARQAIDTLLPRA